MAIITLNNNSLSGVTALPAGVVDANALASGVGGKVLQVVTATDSTQRSTTSTSFVTASNTAIVNITPSSTSSKIYVVCSTNMNCNDGNDSWLATIYRNSTNLGNATNGLAGGNSVPGITSTFFGCTMTLLDSPNTTSSISYQLYVRLHNADADASQVNINYAPAGLGAVPTHITAYEIAG